MILWLYFITGLVLGLGVCILFPSMPGKIRDYIIWVRNERLKEKQERQGNETEARQQTEIEYY